MGDDKHDWFGLIDAVRSGALPPLVYPGPGAKFSPIVRTSDDGVSTFVPLVDTLTPGEVKWWRENVLVCKKKCNVSMNAYLCGTPQRTPVPVSMMHNKCVSCGRQLSGGFGKYVLIPRKCVDARDEAGVWPDGGYRSPWYGPLPWDPAYVASAAGAPVAKDPF